MTNTEHIYNRKEEAEDRGMSEESLKERKRGVAGQSSRGGS